MTGEKPSRLPQVLFEIGKAIGSSASLPTLLVRISELVCELVSAQACSIMLLDAGRRRLLGKAAYGLERRDVSGISFLVGEGVAGWVAERGEAALIDDVTHDPRYRILADSHSHIRSLACVPIAYREERIGVMTITAPRVGAFGPGDVDLLRFIATTMALDIDNARLRRLSVTDPLTEAYNREFLQQQLPQMVDAAERSAEPLALAMIDIDHFKDINDRFGHAVGDQVLTDVARQLRSTIRAGDVLIRYGGEEFLVLLPGTAGEVAVEIAERMRARFEREPVRVADDSIEVRISIGVADHRRSDGPASPDAGAELVKRADQALYAAKAGGRNRVEVAR